MRLPRLAALATIALTATYGCSSEATPRPIGLDDIPETDRSSDGLLHNPILQHVVDLQTRRDAAGLAVFMSHDDPLVRARAAFGAASVQSSHLGPLLVQLLDDSDARVRADAAFALGQTADSTVSDQLLAALQQEHEVVAQTRLIEAIGKTGSKATLSYLTSMQSSVATEREIALAVARFSMRGIQTDESVEWVARRLNHVDPQLRMNASFYFGITPTSRPWALHAAYVRDALEDYALDDPAAMHVVVGLGKFHGADGPLLLQRLADAEDWRVRASTASALAPLSNDLRVIEGLLAALDDPHHHVANAAATSISWSEDLSDQHLDRIATWISDHPDNQTVRTSLLTVLARSERNGFVLNHVRETIKQQQPGLSNLLDAVALVQDDQAFAMLSGLAGSSDHTISLAALDALATRWSVWQGAVDGIDSFFDVFADAVEHANTSTVLAAAISLTNPEFRELGSSSVIASAYARVAAEDVDATIVLLNTLGATNDTQFLPITRRGNQHEHPMVRRAAANAVAELTGRSVTVEDWFTTQSASLDWALLGGLGAHPTLQIETNRGNIAIALATEQAPHAVQSVVRHVQDGSYNGTIFQRVVPNFIVQGGDVNGKPKSRRHESSGKTEHTRIPFRTGVVGLANAGRDTEGAQLFVTHSMQRQLDGSFTSFGYVIDGIEVVNELRMGDQIIKATVLPDPSTS